MCVSASRHSTEQLRVSHDHLRRLAAGLECGREEKRAHITREVHDEFD
jgi:hypothetical protein